MSFFALTRNLAAQRGYLWRRRRYEMFLYLCHVTATDLILDVGSGAGGGLGAFNCKNSIVALDVERWPSDPDRPNIRFVQGDGCDLPFDRGSFDVAFSNSVIEHVPAGEQERFAAEIRRVALRYFVQTPNKWFPIEPHYQLPFFQFLPVRARQFLTDHLQLGWQAKGSTEEITLLSARDMRRLFPDAEIRRERLLGLTKSLMAVRA